MPFPFVYLCDLLNDLERPHISRYPLLPKDLENYTKDKVIRWLRLHRDRLNAFSTDSEAVMSMLQPENQTDREYGLDSGSLELVVARALGLPRQHYLDLQQWRSEPVKGDLGACVKRVVENMDNVSYGSLNISIVSQVDPGNVGDNQASGLASRIILTILFKTITYSHQMATPGQANSVTVEEIDQSLLRIAAFNPRSSPAVQSLASTWKDPDTIELLVNLYQRLKAREAKWLTRVILKSFAPIKFPENLEPGPQHSFLPTCVQLKIQFPSSAPPPVRRDGTRIIAGIGANEPAIHPPNPRRIAQQSSSTAPAPVVAATQTLPIPAVPSPHPASSVSERLFLPPQSHLYDIILQNSFRCSVFCLSTYIISLHDIRLYACILYVNFVASCSGCFTLSIGLWASFVRPNGKIVS